MYFGRWRFGSPMFNEGPSMLKYIRKGPRNELKQTRWVGTGCMLIHRSVFLDIEKKFPTLARKRENGKRGGQWFTSSEHEMTHCIDQTLKIMEESREKGWDNLTMARAFAELYSGRSRTKKNSGLGTGEDVQFCIRAQQAGHQPHVDMGLWCGHIGNECYHPMNTE